MLDHIRIVLIRTSHPGNIGSAARAMKTMGLKRLYLVSPEQFPHDKAKEMASGASDMLDQAIVVDSLNKAIADCSLVIGSSARERTIPWPLFEPREMAKKIKQEFQNNQVAILFGCEQSGLTNEELECCHLHVQIPTDSSYRSLNIAAAVQVIAYELHLMSLERIESIDGRSYSLATMEDMENFFLHLQTVLIKIDFLKVEAPRKLMTRLRRFFLRARPDKMEVNMLRGMLTAIQENRDKF